MGMHPGLSASAKGEGGEQSEEHSDFMNRFSCTNQFALKNQEQKIWMHEHHAEKDRVQINWRDSW